MYGGGVVLTTYLIYYMSGDNTKNAKCTPDIVYISSNLPQIYVQQ